MKFEVLKNMAREIGFDATGVAPVVLLSDEVGQLNRWVAEGKNAGMEYMARNMEVRENPDMLLQGAQSVIVTLTNYYTQHQQSPDIPQIAMYARGKDYHLVIKERLYALLNRIRQEVPVVEGRCFVDSAPVLEHAWAKRAGLGWQGKNTLLITKGLGSFCFIGTLITTVRFDEYDVPFTQSHCGTCNRCVEACPTRALIPGEVDARRCISYQTIENKEEYPEELKRLAGNRIFGCDACQVVCPWNQKLTEHQVSEFTADPAAMNLSRADWLAMDKQQFKKLFKATPLERTGLDRLRQNL